MSSPTSNHDVLNSGNPNETSVALSNLAIGDLLSFLISKATATDAGRTVTSNVATLTAQPVSNGLLQVVGITSGSTRTVKKLRQGIISGTGAKVPAAGECIWDGGTNVLFAAADLAATADFTYVKASDSVASALQADFPAGIS